MSKEGILNAKKEMPMALDVAMFSREQLRIMSEHKFNRSDMTLAIYCVMNHNVNTGAVHSRKISELAACLPGDKPGSTLDQSTIRQSVEKCRESGFAELRIDGMKLTGKLLHLAKAYLPDPDADAVDI